MSLPPLPALLSPGLISPLRVCRNLCRRSPQLKSTSRIGCSTLGTNGELAPPRAAGDGPGTDARPCTFRSYYPNYLAFFHRIISATPPASGPYADKPTSVVPVLEQYLFGGEGQMLVRAVSGALHPLIHIGHGIEFGLDGHVAEGACGPEPLCARAELTSAASSRVRSRPMRCP